MAIGKLNSVDLPVASPLDAWLTHDATVACAADLGFLRNTRDTAASFLRPSLLA
jgi:hypothetical protein